MFGWIVILQTRHQDGTFNNIFWTSSNTIDIGSVSSFNKQMQKSAKALLLFSCIIFMLLKPVSAHIFVKNALHRAQAYSSMQNTLFSSGPQLKVMKVNVDKSSSSLNLNLSSHTLGYVNNNKVDLIAVSKTPPTHQQYSIPLLADFPSFIFRPPRIASA